MTHEEYMKEALELAKLGTGFTSPNPLVGAVIVKDGRIIGRGYHRKYGELHAERNAIADCREDMKGASIYVTLEPCCHYGKTPPCTEAIIENGFAEVFVGSMDPNPKVSGKGVKILRDAGIRVETGILKEECDRLNRIFFHHITSDRPYTCMKYAMTLDGKIATYSGKSKWITGDAARENVHRVRLRYSSIMAGIGTILADDPLLTCRIEGGRNPIRVICDSNLQIPENSNIVKTAAEVPSIIATCGGNMEKEKFLMEKGCRILHISEKNGHLDLTELMKKLHEEGIDSVLLEGGGTLNWTALSEGLADHIQAYIAPKLFGGMDAKSPVAGKGFEAPDLAAVLEEVTVKQFGEDFLIEGEVKKCSQE